MVFNNSQQLCYQGFSGSELNADESHRGPKDGLFNVTENWQPGRKKPPPLMLALVFLFYESILYGYSVWVQPVVPTAEKYSCELWSVLHIESARSSESRIRSVCFVLTTWTLADRKLSRNGVRGDLSANTRGRLNTFPPSRLLASGKIHIQVKASFSKGTTSV